MDVVLAERKMNGSFEAERKQWHIAVLFYTVHYPGLEY